MGSPTCRKLAARNGSPGADQVCPLKSERLRYRFLEGQQGEGCASIFILSGQSMQPLKAEYLTGDAALLKSRIPHTVANTFSSTTAEEV